MHRLLAEAVLVELNGDRAAFALPWSRGWTQLWGVVAHQPIDRIDVIEPSCRWCRSGWSEQHVDDEAGDGAAGER